MTQTRRYRLRRKGSLEPQSGSYADWEIRARVHGQLLDGDDLACPVGTELWAPIAAWSGIDLDTEPPAVQAPVGGWPADLPPTTEGLRFVVRDGERILGPMTREDVLERLDTGEFRAPLASLAGGESWFPIAELGAREAVPTPTPLVHCEACLELIPAEEAQCAHCGEDPRGPQSSAPGSIADLPRQAGFFALHWRPTVTLGLLGGLLGFGIALRYLAPNRFTPQRSGEEPAAAAAAAVCDAPCWNGEACELGHCVWKSPNDVGHINSHPTVTGPFGLPRGTSDVLPIDPERFLAATLTGVHVLSSRDGRTLALVNETPQAQALHRVGDAVYVTSPQRIYALDAATTRLLKTIEIGSRVQSIAVGAGGQQVLASIPGARAVAVISTDFHAEIDRFYFGDDAVGPLSLDESGRVGIVATGELPLPGFRGMTGGALYAFDPSTFASQQDIVRAAMEGNPVDIMTTPDGENSYLVLREKDAVVRLERTPSGAVRRVEELNTCREPEQMELIRAGRRALVRCNVGRELAVYDLERSTLLQRIPLNGRASDIVVSPDALRAIVIMPRDKDGGAVGVLDLETYALSVTELAAEPSRVRIAVDGRSAVVVSDRSKVAWIIR